jgi:lysyl-tRNA synthetase class 2
MICGKVANAYSELNDPIDQRERFESANGLWKGDDEANGVMKTSKGHRSITSGLGIGMDRLIMF